MSWQGLDHETRRVSPRNPSVVAAFAIAGCGDSNKYAAPPPPKVTVATPAERNITSYFDATGNMAAVNSVDLVARVQGFIQEISYTDGDFVKKDTLLFTIEPEPYRLKLLAAQAAEAELPGDAEAERGRIHAPGRTRPAAVRLAGSSDQAQALRDSARANLQSAQAQRRSRPRSISATPK